jgi:hypothetical protein
VWKEVQVIESETTVEPVRVYAARLPHRIHRRARMLAVAHGLSNAQLVTRALAAFEREMRGNRQQAPSDRNKEPVE